MYYFSPQHHNKHDERGFTLPELMVSIGIISLLSAVVLSFGLNAQGRARDAQRLDDIKQIELALEVYNQEFGVYPENSDISNPPMCSDTIDARFRVGAGNLLDQNLMNAGLMDHVPQDPLDDEDDYWSNDYMYQYNASWWCPNAGGSQDVRLLVINNMESDVHNNCDEVCGAPYHSGDYCIVLHVNQTPPPFVYQADCVTPH